LTGTHGTGGRASARGAGLPQRGRPAQQLQRCCIWAVGAYRCVWLQRSIHATRDGA
jgi:hypothetical protein